MDELGVFLLGSGNCCYLTDSGGLQTYHYKYEYDGLFKPVDLSLPEIELWETEYWEKFPKDTLHKFELRKGGLGFYQWHIAPIEKDIRDYKKALKEHDKK